MKYDVPCLANTKVYLMLICNVLQYIDPHIWGTV